MTPTTRVQAGWRCLVSMAALALTWSEAGAAGRVPHHGQAAVAARDLSGAIDPHRARGPEQRLLASLTHESLWRPAPDGAWRATLASAVPAAGRALDISLAAGARFHDGQPVTAEDVAASYRRLATLKGKSAVGGLFAALEIAVTGPGRVRVRGPRRGSPSVLMSLLARPEAAILRGGRPGPGRGAGPFRAPRGSADRDGAWVLKAFAGHVRGRPYLDAVVVHRVADGAALRRAFVFADSDLTVADDPRSRRSGPRVAGVSQTVFAVPSPRHRGRRGESLRRAVTARLTRAALGRYVEGEAARPIGPWPAPLALSRLAYPGRVAGDGPTAVSGLVIAYPEGDAELADLGRAVRDTLRPLVSPGGVARAVPVAGLTLERARDEGDGAVWDFALTRHSWAAATVSEATWELALALGLAPPKATDVLSSRIRGWSTPVTARCEAIAVVHIDRSVRVRPGLRTGVFPTGIVDLANAWRSL